MEIKHVSMKTELKFRKTPFPSLPVSGSSVGDVLGLEVPDIVAIVGFEWTFNVWFVLENDSIVFFRCSWWWKRRFIVDDTRLTSDSFLERYNVNYNIRAWDPHSLQSSTSLRLGASPA
jgi:hypothetical protein